MKRHFFDFEKGLSDLLNEKECEKLRIENEQLKQEIVLLNEKIERYRKLEVELSTTIDLLRAGIIK